MKLKPCPFCGREAKIYTCTGNNHKTEYYPSCKSDECCGYALTDGDFGYAQPSFETEIQATKAWKRRIK